MATNAASKKTGRWLLFLAITVALNLMGAWMFPLFLSDALTPKSFSISVLPVIWGLSVLFWYRSKRERLVAWLAAVGAACFVLLLLARFIFIVDRMHGSSMSPLIGSNDLVIATRCFRSGSLRTGDLVIVDILENNGFYPEARRIQQRTPTGQFYFETANTNCYESTELRMLGALPAEDIRGRIIWIVRGR